ncbi:MAG TPA: zincin-like metallopeptidase domain-containing protein [Mucilaginibacter sp.]|nr:zincin-like metallopeptidase domain-containing protein [Mucilaginibacter sp.]
MNQSEVKETDVYTIVTNRIIERLEKGSVPWQKPWTHAGHPQNLVSKRYYTGINVWMLASLGYTQNYFLTWEQVKKYGASVKKGEKGNLVIFWKRIVSQESEGENAVQKTKSLLRYYFVFNIAQCDHLPEILTIPYPAYQISLISGCEEIIERMPKCPTIKHTKHLAYYHPVKDYINMPKQSSFTSAEGYYCTLFHELIHSSGHPSRLNRKEIAEPNAFGSDPYSIEELTAEIGACYLNSVAGIINKELENSVAYINGWLKVLKDDKRLIVFASGQAQRAVDYILNVPLNKKPEEEQFEVEEGVLL